MKESRNHRRIRGIAILLLAFVVLLFLVALTVPNLILKSNYIRSRLDQGPDRGILDYDSASSRWPGTIHVENLRYRNRDPKAEWGLSLAEGDLTYSLADLLRRRFHVTHLTGSGLAFHTRTRLTPAEATPALLRRIPPIRGFPDPPLISPSPPKTPPTGKEWTLLVDDVAVDSVP